MVPPGVYAFSSECSHASGHDDEMGDNLKLTDFNDHHGRKIVLWVQSQSEARAWCGLSWGQVKTAKIFSNWHGVNDVHPYILSMGSAPVGYGEIWTDPLEKEVELARIIVKPQSRGKGLGQRLVKKLLQKAELFGYPYAFVRVVPKNIAAIRCYKNAGFVPVSSKEARVFNKDQPVEYVWLKCQLTSARERQ